MKRISTAALAAFISMSAAHAEMSDDRMYSAVLAVRATAKIASAYEKCSFDNAGLLHTMIEWASTSCHASDAQLAELRHAYDDELKDVVGRMSWKIQRCQWSPEQTQTEFQADLSRVERYTGSPCGN
jgi:hypothetical protein